MKQDGQHRNNVITLIAVGSNATSLAGSPTDTVSAALNEISNRWDVVHFSHLYQTPAFPAGAGPDFVNAACAFHTTDTAGTVLSFLHGVEAQFGRVRSKRWEQRSLDLDLIGHGGAVLPDDATFEHWQNLPLNDQKTAAPDRLILPHPRLQDRSFVLVPLADVAPDWVHPRLGQTVSQLLNSRPQSERDAVVRLVT